MSFEFFIALRYLKSKQRTGFISLITIISLAGIAIGVAALTITLSILNGFEHEVRMRFIGVNAHVKINDVHDNGFDDYNDIMSDIKSVPNIVAMAPYVQERALIKSQETSTGILVHGIDPEKSEQVLDLKKNINFGEMNVGPIPDDQGKTLPGIILGFNLADRLMVTLGDVVTIYSYSGIKRISQHPYMKQFRVAGYFETGLFEFDDNMAYISLSPAQDIFRMGDKVSGVEIRVNGYEKARKVAENIRPLLSKERQVLTWFDMNQNLFGAMELEKWAAFIILSLIITVAAFNIASTMSMVTMEKTRDIGVLKSMGADSSSIQKIFTFEGLVVGIGGTLIGILVGFILCWMQVKFKFFALPNEYIVDYMPVIIQWTDFISVAIASIIISIVSTVYPAFKAAKWDPVEAIRHEK